MKLGKSRPINRTSSELKTRANNIKYRSIARQIIDGATLSKDTGWPAGRGIERRERDDTISRVSSGITENTSLTVALKLPYNETSKFHIGVWRECCPASIYANLMVTMNNKRGSKQEFTEEFVFTFNDEITKAQSMAWWDSYRARFDNMDEQFIPEFSPGQTVTVSAMPTTNEDNPHYRDNYELFHEWVWLVKNTTSKIYHTREFWLFEDSNELVHFKLMGTIPKINNYDF